MVQHLFGPNKNTEKSQFDVQMHRRTEGGTTVLRPPPSLRHFVKNFTERINFYQYSQPSPSPCTPQYRCLLNITLNNSNEKLSVHIILLLLLFRLCVEGRVFLAVAEISRDLKIDDYAK